LEIGRNLTKSPKVKVVISERQHVVNGRVGLFLLQRNDSCSDLERVENEREWNNGDCNDHLTPVLQMTQIVVVGAEGTVNCALVVRLYGSCPVGTNAAHTDGWQIFATGCRNDANINISRNLKIIRANSKKIKLKITHSHGSARVF